MMSMYCVAEIPTEVSIIKDMHNYINITFHFLVRSRSGKFIYIAHFINRGNSKCCP